MSDAVPAAAAPEMFGPYRVEELLGRGGMGEVHRAYDTVHQRHVALKRLPQLAGAEFRARFRREAKLVAALRDPHVVPIHAHGEIDGQLYLDMRLIDGPDLKRVLVDGPLDPSRATEILGRVANALDAAHARGVLHRDVKPANILLDADGTAYLADFGIARSFAPDVTRLTVTGEQIGTLDYMAPERLTHGDVDAASDVYSLACVLFQCLTGRVPFPATDTVGKLAAQLSDPAPAPSLFDRRITPAMDLVVRTGMDKDPRRRYPSAGELMAAARAATAEAPTAAVIDLPRAADRGQSYFVQLLATHGGGQRTGTVPLAAERCPYPGLQSFGTGDSEWFFGREQAVRDLLVRLARQGPTAGPLIVVGSSGAGKSSLLNAGLLAAHSRHDSTAPRLAMSPGDRPVATLAARLAALLHTDANQLAWRLYQHPHLFGELCQEIAARSTTPLIVIVDQAEELFTQCADVRERETFASAIAHAWPARVVVALRADFVEHCIGLAPLKPSLAAPYVLGPLTPVELARVVARPAEAAGLTLEPGLVDRLITDVGAGRDPGALPRLAHALRETWRNRSGTVLTLKGYQATGGVDRAVALTADGVYARLGEHDQWVMRSALLRMVTLLDDGGIARRRAHPSEIPPPLLEDLVAARLVTADVDHVVLSHDALLTAWPRLRAWVDEDRQGLLIRQQLREAADGWRSGGQDRGDLYRGARLAAALDWSARRQDLTQDERTFLQASERDRRRRTRRLRGLVAGLATLLVLALAAGVVAVVSRNDVERQRVEALSRQLAAESLAEAEVNPATAMRKAVQAWRASPTREARGALISASLLVYPAAFEAGVDNVSSTDVNADGTLVAVGTTTGEVAVWDVEANRRLDLDLAAAGTVAAVRFSPDGSLLAVSSLDAEGDQTGVRIWELPSGRAVSSLREHQVALGAVAWRPDGKVIAAASIRADDEAWVGEWNPRTGKLIRWVANGAMNTSSLAYGPDGDRLVVGHGDGAVALWEPATATRISRHTGHGDGVADTMEPVSVAYSTDLIATSSVSDNLIRLWDARTGAPVRTFPDITRHATDISQGPSALAFTTDGAVLYTNSDANTITAWDPVSGNYLGALPQGSRPGTAVGRTVIALAMSGDGRTRIAANNDGTVLRWKVHHGWFSRPVGSILGLGFNADSTEFAAGDAEGGLYVWDTETGQRIGGSNDVEGGVFGLQYTPDGNRITITRKATVTATPPGPGKAAERIVTLPDRAFWGVAAVSPDGAWLAVAHGPADPIHDPETNEIGNPEDNKIHVWDARTLTEHAVLDVGEHQPVDLTFAPDSGELLALTSTRAGADGVASNLMTWQAPDFTIDQRYALGGDTLNTMAIVPGSGGTTMITAGTTGELQLRDVRDGRLRGTFGRHPATIRDVAISPDGRTVASVTTEDAEIRLWSLPDQEPVATLHGHAGPLNRIEFSPDGRWLASGGTDTDVALWPVRPADALRQICANLRDIGAADLDDVGC